MKFSQKHKVLCASLSDKDKVAISDHIKCGLIMNYTYKSSCLQWILNFKEKMRMFWQNGFQEKDSVRVEWIYLFVSS